MHHGMCPSHFLCSPIPPGCGWSSSGGGNWRPFHRILSQMFPEDPHMCLGLPGLSSFSWLLCSSLSQVSSIYMKLKHCAMSDVHLLLRLTEKYSETEGRHPDTKSAIFHIKESQTDLCEILLRLGIVHWHIDTGRRVSISEEHILSYMGSQWN